MPTFPTSLVTAKQKGLLVPFVGAGLSLGRDVRGSFPAWRELPTRLLAECDSLAVWQNDHDRRSLRSRFLEPDPNDATREIPRAMDLQEMLGELDTLKAKLLRDYRNALTRIFRPRDAAPGAAHRALARLDAKLVLTTNYDQLLEALEGPPSRQIYTWRQSPDALSDIKADGRVLFKIHGSAEADDSVVLTMKEYERIQSDSAYKLVMQHLLIGHTFLFVGYGMSDPHDLDLILSTTVSDLRSAATHHYALLRPLDDRHDEAARKARLRRDYSIDVISYNDHADVIPLLEALALA